jgi:hypothetical protein
MTWFSTISDRSLIGRTSNHILSDKFCSIASLSALISYYIVILLHNNIYWSKLSSLFLICVNIFSFADFDLTSSFRSRFLFLLLITTSAQQRTIYSFICCQLLIVTRSFAVFSVTCVEEGILRLHQGIGSEARRRSVLERLAHSSAFSAAPSLQFSTVFMLGLSSSFHSFILICSLISLQFVSFIMSCSFTHSLIHSFTSVCHVWFDLID